ncbi:CoA-transferase family III [Tilletiaria anomala UBC 951]|uniref:CoA-transferase family III n=1 Tax=Tilletiaria anomala (strain ATCC 24038 / CBS 436.72 / UBC 951) TaxID=1037660 RepID=A0A066V3S8_TILAU|nr:CoA-transferase family III [Tilletiaria anomala UBC 951]KDN36131.1 CoA-transferase family III [Tilletiaria anomala UBC 951]
MAHQTRRRRTQEASFFIDGEIMQEPPFILRKASQKETTEAPPLRGLKVVEFAGLAPGPFVGLILADFGADVIRIDKVGAGINTDTLTRGKRSIAVDPKSPTGLKTLRRLIREADVLIEPFRPGVMERLGLGPEHVVEGKGGGEGLSANPRLVYARLTGFQRQGPYANMAGHDINYIALSGVLSMLSNQSASPSHPNPPPSFPANLLADFAGGSLICLVGILLALISRAQTSKGQVVEADMVTGARYVATFQVLMSYIVHPQWGAMFGKGDKQSRGTGVLDGAAPWYGVYKTRDDKWMSVGAIEPQFYAELLRLLRASVPSAPESCPPHPSPAEQHSRSEWPNLRIYFTTIFAQRTRAAWTETFLGTDACCVPVLDRDEALLPAGSGREAGVTLGGGILPYLPSAHATLVQSGEHNPIPPSPAPALRGTPARIAPGSAEALARSASGQGGEDEDVQLLMNSGEHTFDILREWIGASDQEIEKLYRQKAIGATDVPEEWNAPASKL